VELRGLYDGPCRCLAAPFDKDIPPNTCLTEYGGIPMGELSARPLFDSPLGKWILWLMRGQLYVNGCPTDFRRMADEDWVASIADHSSTPNAVLERKEWISPRTGHSPAAFLRSGAQTIPRSTPDRLSLITVSYGNEDEAQRHGIVHGISAAYWSIQMLS